MVSFPLFSQRMAVSESDAAWLGAFQSIADDLLAHQDKQERLIRLSRDITQESKRVIFLLHQSVR